MAEVCAVVLAAGAGRRAGGPKGLRRDPDGTPWVERVVGALSEGGCDRVLVVVGAEAESVAALVPPEAQVVVADDWAAGMSASLRTGLAAAGGTVLVTLVDLPDLPAAVVRRLLDGAGPATVRQAVFTGRPGHPVVLGADHRDAVAASLTGDRGARDWLVEHGVEAVECADLWHGRDRDE